MDNICKRNLHTDNLAGPERVETVFHLLNTFTLVANLLLPALLVASHLYVPPSVAATGLS